MDTRAWVDLVGWVGAACLCGAYGLASSGRVAGRSVAYQALNLVGALGLIVNSAYHGALPSVGLNLFWAGVGLFTLRSLARAAPPAAPPSSGADGGGGPGAGADPR